MASNRILPPLILVATLAICASSFTLQHPNNGRENNKVPNFSPVQRHLLSVLSKVKPEIFGGVTFDEILKHAPTPQEYPQHLYIDYYFVELRQLLTQAIKLPKTTTLPELDWSEYYDFCIWIWCFDFTASLTTAGSSLVGTQSITSRNEVTPTSFINTFNVPHVSFNSPNFAFQLATGSGEITTWEGYQLIIDNLTIVTKGNYRYEEDVGIIVSTLEIDLSVWNMTSKLDSVTMEDGLGVIDRLGPFYVDIKEQTDADWNYARDRYTENLLIKLNCLLNRQRAFPAKCTPSSDEAYNDYYQFLVTQVIQTIGLGSLLK